MKLYKASAIVLQAINIRDADQMIIFFSREYGKIRAMAYGVRKPTSRKRGSLQPFSLSRLLLHRGQEIDSVSQCEAIEMFPEIHKSLDKLGYAIYLTELVETLTAEGEPNENIFWLLLNALRLLATNDLELLARAFEIKLVTFLGYSPLLDHCVACRRSLTGIQVSFDEAAGGFLCLTCARQGSSLLWCHRGTVEILKFMLRSELNRSGHLRVNQGTKRELRTVLQKHIEYHFGYTIKSMRFLEMLETTK